MQVRPYYVSKHACIKYAKRVMGIDSITDRQMSMIGRHLDRAIQQYVSKDMLLNNTSIKAPDFDCTLRFKKGVLATVTIK